MTGPSLRTASAARRAICAVLLASAVAALAPMLVWLDPDLVRLAVVPQVLPAGTPHAIGTAARVAGAAAMAVPCGLLAWGLLGLLPTLRALGAGQAITAATGTAVARLGTAVALAGAYEPLGRAVLGLALTMGQTTGEIRIALGLSANAGVLVALGILLVALGHVLRDAAAAVAENQGFV